MIRVRVNAPHLKSHGKTGTVEREHYWSTGLTGVRLDDGHHISIASCNLETLNKPVEFPDEGEHVGLIYVHDRLKNPTDMESAKDFIGELEPYAVMYGTFNNLSDFIQEDDDILDCEYGEKCFAIWNDTVFPVEITRQAKLTV